MFVLFLALANAAAPPAGIVSVLSSPGNGVWLQWARLPTQAEIDAQIPPGETGGHYAAMACQAKADGTLTACAIIPGVTSPGGFGKAALSLADRFQLAPDMIASATTPGTKVEIVMHFGEDM